MQTRTASARRSARIKNAAAYSAYIVRGKHQYSNEDELTVSVPAKKCICILHCRRLPPGLLEVVAQKPQRGRLLTVPGSHPPKPL